MAEEIKDLETILENNPELEKKLKERAISSTIEECCDEPDQCMCDDGDYIEPVEENPPSSLNVVEVTPLELDDLPCVSVLMPTYERREFLPLVLYNISHLNYPPEKIELVILDDSKDNPLFLDEEEVKFTAETLRCEFKYYRESKKFATLGEKRNKLVELAKHKICINIDDDDLYMPSYIHYSVSLLKQEKYGLVGSPQMLYLYPEDDYKLCGNMTPHPTAIKEATMCFTKKYFNSMGGFKKCDINEGIKMLEHNEKQIGFTECALCMISIAHKKNLIDKEPFKNMEIDGSLELTDDMKGLISSILKGD